MATGWNKRTPNIILSVISSPRYYKRWKDQRQVEDFQTGIIKVWPYTNTHDKQINSQNTREYMCTLQANARTHDKQINRQNAREYMCTLQANAHTHDKQINRQHTSEYMYTLQANRGLGAKRCHLLSYKEGNDSTFLLWALKMLIHMTSK